MNHPEIRDPTIGKPDLDELYAGLAKQYERKEMEEKVYLEKIDQHSARLAILEKKIDLLLEKAKVKEIDVKEAEGQDIAEELIFPDD